MLRLVTVTEPALYAQVVAAARRARRCVDCGSIYRWTQIRWSLVL